MMTTISDLAMRIDDEGLEAVIPALRGEGAAVAELARRAHVSPVLAEMLTSDSVSDVMWLRAFVQVRAELSRLGDRLELAA